MSDPDAAHAEHGDAGAAEPVQRLVAYQQAGADKGIGHKRVPPRIDG